MDMGLGLKCTCEFDLCIPCGIVKLNINISSVHVGVMLICVAEVHVSAYY